MNIHRKRTDMLTTPKTAHRRKALALGLAGAITLLPMATPAAHAETKYGGNGYCQFKVQTIQSSQTFSGRRVDQAVTIVQDWNGGCSLLNAGLKYSTGSLTGDTSIKTVYYGATNTNRIDLIRNGYHHQGAGYGYDPERSVGVWTSWFG